MGGKVIVKMRAGNNASHVQLILMSSLLRELPKQSFHQIPPLFIRNTKPCTCFIPAVVGCGKSFV